MGEGEVGWEAGHVLYLMGCDVCTLPHEGYTSANKLIN